MLAIHSTIRLFNHSTRLVGASRTGPSGKPVGAQRKSRFIGDRPVWQAGWSAAEIPIYRGQARLATGQAPPEVGKLFHQLPANPTFFPTE